MTTDRRTSHKPTAQDVRRLLNSEQIATVRRSRYFGWQIRFVRQPLFQDPVVVVHNSRYGLIGILDADGHIDTDVNLDVRATERQAAVPHPQGADPAGPGRSERRRNKPFARSNLDRLLNEIQSKSLRNIERFGWQLNFVRQPLSRHPVVVLIGPKGDKIGTLERDGRIKLLPRSEVRRDPPCEQKENVQSLIGSEHKTAK